MTAGGNSDVPSPSKLHEGPKAVFTKVVLRPVKSKYVIGPEICENLAVFGHVNFIRDWVEVDQENITRTLRPCMADNTFRVLDSIRLGQLGVSCQSVDMRWRPSNVSSTHMKFQSTVRYCARCHRITILSAMDQVKAPTFRKFRIGKELINLTLFHNQELCTESLNTLPGICA